LTKKYLIGDNEIQVLNGVNLEIYSGEYIIFFGPSGSGKSTILNTICGLEPPTSGEVVVRGENIAKFNNKQIAKYRRDKIGIVFQQFNLIKSFRVWENVAFTLTNDGDSLKTRRERSISLLGLLGLSKFVDRLPTELSGGQQQRVAIARALATNPWIIIADEPTGNLDSKSANDVMTVLRILNKKSRRTIIMVTHNPDYLSEADRVFYVKDGLIDRIQVNRHHEGTDNEVGRLDELRELAFHDEQKQAEKTKTGKETAK
jgi:putative ABC transport system ATP-binding protein